MSLTPLILETGVTRRRQWKKREDPWDAVRACKFTYDHHSDAATSFVLLDLFSWLLTCLTGEGPSVFVKSPVEHQIDRKIALNQLPYDKRWRVRYMEVNGGQVIPDGHVRLRLFNTIKDMVNAKPTLYAVIALEPSGALDIRKVKALWGLETCSIVDPYRLKLFIPENEDLISPLAVNDLSQHYGCINIIEPTVSPLTSYRRRFRLTLLRPVSGYISSLSGHISYKQDQFVTWLRKKTNVVDWAEEAQRDALGTVQYAGRQLEGWAAENHPDLLYVWESTTINVMFTLILLLLLWRFGL